MRYPISLMVYIGGLYLRASVEAGSPISLPQMLQKLCSFCIMHDVTVTKATGGL